jgi:hypothetical protein
MANLFNNPYNLMCLVGGPVNSGTETGWALNGDFVYLTSGPCLGIRFVAPPGGTHLHSAYVFLHAEDSSAQDLTCYLAADNGGTKAGAEIQHAHTSGGTTIDKWIKFDFSAFTDALTAGTYYWIVVGDLAGNGDTYQIRSRITTLFAISNSGIVAYSSTDGFASNTTAISPSCPVILVFHDGTVKGNPYTERLADTSNTYERGIKITGLTEQLSVVGIFLPAVSANMSTIQILEAATAPGGAIWSGFNGGVAQTLTANQKTSGQFIQFPSIVTFAKDTTYRLTIRYSVATTIPGYSNIEDSGTPGADATACSFLQGRYCRTISDNTGGWIDTPTALEGIALALYDQVAIQVPIPGNVTEDDSVNNVTGTYHEATVAEVQDGVMFGAGSALEGTYAGGGTNIKVMVNGAWKAIAGAWVMVNGLWKSLTS